MRNLLMRLRDKILRIDKLKYKIVKETLEDSDFKFKELKAIEILRPYFPKGFLFETGYTLSFQEIQHIANDIVIHKPQTILEIGSGLSTIILSNIIAEMDYRPEFFSIDQDSAWQAHLRGQCKNVSFYAFKISSKSEFTVEGSKWFEIPKNSLLRIKNYDLVIIDGPKGSESKYARLGIVNFLKEKIAESSIIFLDDTHREEEKFVLKQFQDVFSYKKCQSFRRYSRLSNKDLIITTPS